MWAGLCLALALSAQPSGPESAGYGSLPWGLRSDSAPTPPAISSLGPELSVSYDPNSQFGGRPARRWLYFVRGELAAVVLLLQGQQSDGATETEIFSAARSMLSGTFGPSRQVEASEIPAGWLGRNDGSPGQLTIIEEWTAQKTEVRLGLFVSMEEGGAPAAKHRLSFVSRSRGALLATLLARVGPDRLEPDARPVEPAESR